MYIILKVKKIIYKIFIIFLSLSVISVTAYSCFNLFFAQEPENYQTSGEQPSKDSIKLPILMYHSILKSKSSKFITNPSKFENDLQYIQSNGFTTVTVKDLTNYVFNDIPLPEKPIMITFDDGLLNNYTYAVPLLEKYGMKAVLSIVGIYTEENNDPNDRNPNYSYLNINEINELIGSGVIEIQCHSYNLHKNTVTRHGANKNKSEPLDVYKDSFTDDINKFRKFLKDNLNYEVTAFVYPFGSYSESSEIVIRENGFLSSFTCREKINYITGDNACLYKLGRFNRHGEISTEEFFKKVLKNY